MPEKKSEPLIELWKKPKGVTVIQGFPGFGLVATIATGFLIDHLKCEQIGRFWFEDTQPTIAIHNCQAVDPIGIFYNKQHNLSIIHSIAPVNKLEWRAADLVLDICEQLDAKEVVTLEGVGSTEPGDSRGFFYSETAAHKKKFEKIGIDCLGEGIIVGVTAALLLKTKQTILDICCLFAETHSQLPDSKAAAKIIELVDKYYGLNVDYKPLLQQAEEFEERLKTMVEQQSQAQQLQKKKDISYVG